MASFARRGPLGLELYLLLGSVGKSVLSGYPDFKFCHEIGSFFFKSKFYSKYSYSYRCQIAKHLAETLIQSMV